MATTGSWSPISRIEVGGVSLVSASKANEIIDALNALCQLQVNPAANAATWIMSTGKATLDLSRLEQRIANLEAQSIYTGANVNCVGSTAVITFTPAR